MAAAAGIEEPTLFNARRLYFEAHFEECLTVSRSLHVKDDEERSEVALLIGRSLLRLERYAEVEHELARTDSLHRSLDAQVTSTMLMAMSKIRRGDATEGLALLAPLSASEVHASIKSEIALYQALGYWVQRDFPSCREYLRQVAADADIIHARALELESFCYLSEDKVRDAARCFIATLLRLDGCRQKDYAVAARALLGLSATAFDLFDADAMRIVETRYHAMDWTPGIAASRAGVEYYIAAFYDIVGDYEKTIDYALLALEHASTDQYRALVYAALAQYADHAGIDIVGKSFVARAIRLIQGVPDENNPDFQLGTYILLIADAVAKYDWATARKLFLRHLRLPNNPMMAASGSVQLQGVVKYTEGGLYEAEGENDAAIRCFREAYDLFVRAESITYSAMTASALVRLTGDTAMTWYIAGVLKGADSWLRRNTSEGMPFNSGATVTKLAVNNGGYAKLSESQREVVALVCQGKSYREIAHIRGVTEQTIKNMLSARVYKAFGVSTRAELIDILLLDPEERLAQRRSVVG